MRSGVGANPVDALARTDHDDGIGREVVAVIYGGLRVCLEARSASSITALSFRPSALAMLNRLRRVGLVRAFSIS
jgi:predicted deacylase